MQATPNPMRVRAAHRVTVAQVTRRDAEAFRLRKAAARSRGYHGPLTRAELAARCGQ